MKSSKHDWIPIVITIAGIGMIGAGYALGAYLFN